MWNNQDAHVTGDEFIGYSTNRTWRSDGVRDTVQTPPMVSTPEQISDNDSEVGRFRASLSSERSDDSLVKLKGLVFHLPLPDEAISPDEIKNRLWPPFKREHAVDMEVMVKAGELEITVYFKTLDDGLKARLYISRNRMKRCLAGHQQGPTTAISSSGSVKLDYSRFVGPNSQKQKRTQYKTGECSLGCTALVSKDHMETHKLTCPAHLSYLQFRKNYEKNEKRLSERPNPFYISYNDEQDDHNHNIGFIYGHGPRVLNRRSHP